VAGGEPGGLKRSTDQPQHATYGGRPTNASRRCPMVPGLSLSLRGGRSELIFLFSCGSCMVGVRETEPCCGEPFPPRLPAVSVVSSSRRGTLS